MAELYQVAVHFAEDNGYVEYDEENKQVRVFLADRSICDRVKTYLTSEHKINVPQDTLLDFRPRSIRPVDNLRDFQLGLTRMWGQIAVYVDWSRPVTAK